MWMIMSNLAWVIACGNPVTLIVLSKVTVGVAWEVGIQMQKMACQTAIPFLPKTLLL